ASKAARWPAVSCIQPRSPASLGTWVVMCSTRKLEASASPIPAKALNAPGPVLVMQTPTRPVVRAYPTAANAAACSWRTTTVRIGEPLSASHRLSACCPGIPNTISTPCASSAETSRSAPVATLLSCATLMPVTLPERGRPAPEELLALEDQRDQVVDVRRGELGTGV